MLPTLIADEVGTGRRLACFRSFRKIDCFASEAIKEDAMSTSFQKSEVSPLGFTSSVDVRMLGRRNFLALLGAGALGCMASPAFAEETKLAALIDEAPQTHVLIPALRNALASLDALKAIVDYESTFTKIEKIGRSTITSKMLLKIRHEPFSVYVKYLDPHEGREAIYVHGKNDGKVVVHDTGLASLAGTLKLDPLGSTAMGESRYPVYKVGMKLLVETIMGGWIQQAKQNAGGITVNHYPNSKIGDQSCHAIETVLTLPIGTESFQTTRLYFDSKTNLPVRLQQYAFPERRGQKPTLVEDYLYQSVKTNIGLTDADFDPNNPRYGY
jgi:hypothetical protein